MFLLLIVLRQIQYTLVNFGATQLPDILLDLLRTGLFRQICFELVCLKSDTVGKCGKIADDDEETDDEGTSRVKSATGHVLTCEVTETGDGWPADKTTNDDGSSSDADTDDGSKSSVEITAGDGPQSGR